jgi:hypothetical protein
MLLGGIDKQAAWKRIMKLDIAGKPVEWKLLSRPMWANSNGSVWNFATNSWMPGSEGPKASMRWADLSKPINERLASVVGYGDPKAWLK